MIFLVNNSTKYFFPIFLINYKNNFDLLAIIILVIELTGYLLASVLTIRGCYIIYNSRVFHWNLNILFCGCFLQWFEILAGRLMMVSYDKGWTILEGNDPMKTFSVFYTFDISEMPRIHSLWEHPFLSIGMLLITHYYVFAMLCLTGITIERSCATYWLNDYESKKRPGISISILISLEIISALIVYTAINQVLDLQYWNPIGFIFIAILNFLLFGYVWYRNIRVHEILNSVQVIPKEYTLQARFQTKENARSLNLIKSFVILVSFCVLIECSIFIIQWTRVLKKYEVILYYLLGFINSQNPVILIPFAMMSVPRWRRQFFKHFTFIPGFQKFVSKNNVKVIKVIKVKPTIRLETEEYFNQLKRAWK